MAAGHVSGERLTWLVYGPPGTVSEALLEHALEKNHIATHVWSTSQPSSVPEKQKDVAEDSGPLETYCEIPDWTALDHVVQRLIGQAGRLDIVVVLPKEESGGREDVEVRGSSPVKAQISHHYTTALRVIQATLPRLRQQKGGHYFICSPTLGDSAVPGLGPLHAASAAVEGLVEGMVHETGSGIRATCVFGWASCAAQTADIMCELSQCPSPPLKVALGKQAAEGMYDGLQSLVEEIDDWREICPG